MITGQTLKDYHGNWQLASGERGALVLTLASHAAARYAANVELRKLTDCRAMDIRFCEGP